jgi:hydrogenase-4 component E
VTPWLNSLLVAVLLLNLVTLGASRIRTVIRAVALEGILLGGMPMLVHGKVQAAAIFLSVAVILVKGVAIPALLERALSAAAIKREVEPIIGFLPSVLLGALATGIGIGFGSRLPLAEAHRGSLIVPASLATSIVGLILLVSRRKAVSQVQGYLVLENGILIFGLLLIEAMPFLVELGALLDLFVGVFVLSIILHHINREFASLDTRKLASLKE